MTKANIRHFEQLRKRFLNTPKAHIRANFLVQADEVYQIDQLTNTGPMALMLGILKIQGYWTRQAGSLRHNALKADGLDICFSALAELCIVHRAAVCSWVYLLYG